MKTLYRTLAVCAMIALAGCAASTGTGKMTRGRTTAANTPAARPEATIANSTKKDVTDALVGEVVSRGFTVVSVTDYTVVFSKPIAAAPTSMKRRAGSSGGSSEQRLSFTIAKAGDGVHIVLIDQLVTNPGSTNERVSDANGGPAGDEWRKFLASFPVLFKGRVGMTLDNNGTVVTVAQGSPAMTAGIQTGDKIVRVDGAPYTRPDQLIGDPDTKVIVVVQRQGKEVPFILYRKVLK